MQEWNKFPDPKNIKNSDLEAKLNTEVRRLKTRFAELSIEDPNITVRQALEIVKTEFVPENKAYETSVLYLTVERLKLENVLNIKVRKYLPNFYYRDKGKHRHYFPKYLNEP